jgi:hypothetical protein
MKLALVITTLLPFLASAHTIAQRVRYIPCLITVCSQLTLQRQRRRQRRSSRHPHRPQQLPDPECQRRQHRLQLQLQAARVQQGDCREGW